MILDEPYKIYDAIIKSDVDTLNLFHKSLLFIMKNDKYQTFYSTSVPDVPDASWIAFSFYKDTPIVTVGYKSKGIYTAIIKENLDEYVFTNCMLDLNTLTPVNVQDVIERIAKEKSR